MSSRRTEALKIKEKTKIIVNERDKDGCIICHTCCGIEQCNSHIVRRSQDGLGIPQNICKMCWPCHYKWDNCPDQETRDWMVAIITEHMQQYYPGWDINDPALRYDKHDQSRW